jgi:hypothetical protein
MVFRLRTLRAFAVNACRSPAFLIAFTYVLLALMLLSHHEPYRDEAQAWLIARDSPDLAALFHQMGYEGTPALWHLLLLPLARLGLPFVTASYLNFVIILVAVILLVRHAPFPWFHKALLVFGYYFIYEYCVFARSYSLSVLLLFLIATFYPKRFQQPLLHASLLALLANANLHGLVIALILAGFYLGEFLFIEKRQLAEMPRSWFAIALLGFAVAVVQIWPPDDVLPPRIHQGGIPSLVSASLTFDHLVVIQRVLVGAFLPIPCPTIQFWNTKLVFWPIEYLRNLPMTPSVRSVLYSFALVLPAGLSLGLFVGKAFPLLMYSSLTLGLLSIFFLIYDAGVRHQGLVYIVFVFCLWVSCHYAETDSKRFSRIHKIFTPRYRHLVVVLLLSFQVLATPIAAYFEWKYDFSCGRKTAAYLLESGLLQDKVLIASSQSSQACSILPYLKSPYDAFYFLEYQDMRSFMTWDRVFRDNRELSAQEIMDRVDGHTWGKYYDRVLLISNKKILDRDFQGRFSEVAHFGEAIDDIESFYIYQLSNDL